MVRALCVLAGVATCVVAALVMRPPEDDDRDKKGPPSKGFVLGKLLPPHVREGIDLSDEQRKQIAELEAETRKRLEKILTPEQQARIRQLGKQPPEGKKGKKGPPREEPKEEAKAGGGIMWFTSLDAGRSEAKRTGRNRVCVDAAPSEAEAGAPGPRARRGR